MSVYVSPTKHLTSPSLIGYAVPGIRCSITKSNQVNSPLDNVRYTIIYYASDEKGVRNQSSLTARYPYHTTKGVRGWVRFLLVS